MTIGPGGDGNSFVGKNVVQVFVESDFGTVNVGVNIDVIPNTTFVLMNPVVQTLPLDIATGASMQLLTTNRAVNILTYTNVSEPQFRGKNIGTFAIFDVVTNGNRTGTLVDIDGGVVSWKFPDFNGYSSGGVLRNLISIFAPGVLFEFVDSGIEIIDCQTSSITGCLVLAFDGNTLNGFDIKGENSGHFQFYDNVLESDDFATLLRVGADFSNISRIGILGSEVINSNSSLFDTSGGSTGTFTGVADAAISLTTIDSVTDSGGVARFNFTVGPTLFVDQEIDISNFVTETNYNQTGIISAVGAGFFEIASIPFTADDNTGDFSSNSITLTDTATSLSDSDTLSIDTDNATNYDGGATVYNQLTNSFQINRTFTTTHTGKWDTSGIDQKDSRVLATQNLGFLDSKYTATAFVNDNSTANGAIVNNTFTDMVFGTSGNALIIGSTMERWKLIDELNGTFEYTGNEPFDGSITFDFTFLSSGGSQDFKNKWIADTGSGFVDLDDNVESLVNVGSDAQSITKTFPLLCEKGCKIKPQITRVSGSSAITTVYASIYATQ